MTMRSMRGAALALLACASIVLTPQHTTLVAAKIDPNDKGEPLFPDGHPNITFLTDDNWDTWMDTKTDKPWLVDFYHPFCPHCKLFVPSFIEIAAYYKARGDIYVGAISCMDHVKCRRVGIKGFPTLITLNFDVTRPKAENKRVVGTHTVQEVKDYVDSVWLEAKINATGTQPPTANNSSTGTGTSNATANGLSTAASAFGDHAMPVVSTTPVSTIAAVTPDVKPGEELRSELWEESTLPMNATTRLQDAGSAFVFGLKQGVFMGREVLEDDELDALKRWLDLVAQTFPGTTNRVVLSSLATRVAPIALLDFDTWDALVTAWQTESVELFAAEEQKRDFTLDLAIPEWQRVADLFVGYGVSYRACALYTCGQWNLFHMLTMNPIEPVHGDTRSPELLVSVVATIRRFVKHFFGCAPCRDHFLEANTIETVQRIASAPNKPLALRRWLWEMHNTVNTRILHPQWPKPDVCPTCGHAGNWEVVEVDKWLARTYAFREVAVPLKKPAHTKKHEPALRTNAVADSTITAETTTTTPAATIESTYKPKDAELGIANHANTKSLVHDPQKQLATGRANAKADAQSLQSERAPPVTLFAWYCLPVLAVGAYLLFVRARRSKPKGYHRPRNSSH